MGDPEAVDNPTVKKVLNGPYAEEWENSINNKNVSLVKREVFEVVDLHV